MITKPQLVPVVEQAAPAPPEDPNTGHQAIDVLARTIWGEARGEGTAGMNAVAAVVINRVQVAEAAGGRYWWGADVVSVCKRPWQFSCWNEGDPNRTQIASVDATDPYFATALRIARRAIHRLIPDPTIGDGEKGATHYHHRGIMPSWAIGQRAQASIGQHLFYRLVD
ncbi:MAG: cell wall hydrolase [Pseudomonadota bacterium]